MHTQPILPTLEIRASAAKQIGLLALAIGSLPVLIWVAFLAEDASVLVHLSGLVGIVGIVGFTPGVVRKAIAAKGRVLELSAKGLRDFRMSSSIVPWEEIVGFGEQSTSGVRFLRVDVTEAGWAGMPMARWVRLLASRRSQPYFVISVQTTGVAFDDLAALVHWYHGVTVGQLPANAPAPIAIDDLRTDRLVAA